MEGCDEEDIISNLDNAYLCLLPIYKKYNALKTKYHNLRRHSCDEFCGNSRIHFKDSVLCEASKLSLQWDTALNVLPTLLKRIYSILEIGSQHPFLI